MFRLLVGFLLLTTSLLADDRSVVALEVRGEATIQRGSAVLIATSPEARRNPGRYALITASHCVVDEQTESPGKPVVRTKFPIDVAIEVYLKDRWYPCTINSYSAKGDLALLEVDCDVEMHLSAVSLARPAINSPVRACGFVLGLDQQSISSTVQARDWTPTLDMLTCPTAVVVPGMSGGAVFDATGEVCGVISSITATAPWEVQYTHSDEVNRFVKTYEPRALIIGPRPPLPVKGDRAVPRHLAPTRSIK